MRFADRVSQVSPSVTLGLNARTLELRRAGKDIVAFGVGEPDIDTPDVVCEAGKRAIDERKCRYTATAGVPELRQAICGYISQVYGLDYEPAQVMASSGAKQVLYNSISAVVGPGDELIIPAPYWTSYPEMVHLAGATPRLVATSPEQQFKLTPQALESAIGPNTRGLLFNSPSNPTGIAYTLADLEALGEVLSGKDIWILSDDIYCTLLFDDYRFACFAQLPGFRERTILINGVSKTFSMTGWRLGFAAGSREAIAAMTKLQDHSTSCPNAVGQYAAAEALRQGPELTAAWVSTLAERRDLMIRLLEAIPGLCCIRPQGAFYLFVDVRSQIGPGGRAVDSVELADGLLVDAGVGTIPGEAFGAPGFLRLSFAVSLEDIAKGVGRMKEYLEQ